VSVVCAAKLSLGSASLRVLVCHSSTAPQLPFRRICPVDQRASAVVGAFTHRRFGHSNPKKLARSRIR
jgi:hypothetical protein